VSWLRDGSELTAACLRSQPTWMSDHRDALAQVDKTKFFIEILIKNTNSLYLKV
jgi:hypothetical protein